MEKKTSLTMRMTTNNTSMERKVLREAKIGQHPS